MRQFRSFLFAAIVGSIAVFCLAAASRAAEGDPPASAPAARTGQQWFDHYWPIYLKTRGDWQAVARDQKRFDAFWENLSPVEKLMRGFCLTKDSMGEKLNYAAIGDQLGHGGNWAERWKLIQEYQAWEKEIGWPMMLRWRQGKLTDEEREYEPLLRAAYVRLGAFVIPRKGAQATDEEKECARQVTKMVRQGHQTLDRAFRGALLTAADLDDVRVLIQLRMISNVPGVDLLPLQPQVNGLLTHGQAFLDEPFQSRRFLRYESALNSPLYSDEWPSHPFLIMKPEAVVHALIVLPFHERLEREAKANAFEERMGWLEKDFVDLKSFRGKKPVLLWPLGHSPKDDDAYNYFIYPEILKQAYGDRIEVIYVATGDNACEVRFRGKGFIGPSIDYSRIGTVGHEVPDAPTLPEDMARDVKMHEMAWPWITVPCIVDSAGYEQIRHPIYPDRSPLLIDIDGRVAMVCDDPGLAFVGHPDWSGTGPQMPGEIAWVEREIRLLLENNGRAMRKHKEEHLEEVRAVAQGERYSGRVGRIEKIDLQGGMLTVLSLDGKATASSYPFDANPQNPSRTRFFDLCGSTDSENFKRGDWVNVCCDPHGRATMIKISSRYERALRHYPDLRDPDLAKEIATVDKLIGTSYWWDYSLFVPAEVTAVDPVARTLTLKRKRLKTEEMFGLRFCKEAGERCKLYDPEVRRNHALLEAALASFEKDPVVELCIPKGAWLYRNGLFQPHLDRIKPGDQVLYGYSVHAPDKQRRVSSGIVYVSEPLKPSEADR